MQKQPKRYRGFIAHSRKDEAKARRLQRMLERYRVPRGVDFETQGKDRKLGRFFRENDETEDSLHLGAALEGALADSESLIVVCSPQAVASDRVEREIIHFRTLAEPAPVVAVIVNGRPNVADSPNLGKAARECFPAALTREINPDGKLTDRRVEPLTTNLRKEGIARTRARIAAAVIDVPFDELWRRDRGRAWAKRLMFGAGALCIVGALAFGGLAMLGLQMRGAHSTASAIGAKEAPVNTDAAVATVVACGASVESVRAWDGALETGMRTKEYREMEKVGSVFKEAMYVCAATTGRRSTEQNARALCDRLNDATVPQIAANDSPAYVEAMSFMAEQLQTVKATCATRLK